MITKVKVNYDQDLWCNESKEPIENGEKYVEIIEGTGTDEIVKTYKLEFAPIQNEEDEPYVG